MVDHERLEGVGQERPQHEEAPHAVDDRRNAGEQLDGDGDRPAQPLRAELGQEDRNAEADRNRDQHGDERRDQGAVDGTERAEHRLRLRGRRPALRPEELEAEGLHRRPRADDQREDDAAENAEDRERGEPRRPIENVVAELERAERARAIKWPRRFQCSPLNDHVSHAIPHTYIPATCLQPRGVIRPRRRGRRRGTSLSSGIS